MNDNADQIAYWNDVAGPKWVAGQNRLDALMAPLTAALLDAAAVQPGETVLDVGCGCGETALRAAEAAGPAGRVVAVDVSAPMLAHGRARAEALRSAAPIEWRRADAALAPPVTGADLLLSRFGVMFFADRLVAFRTLRGALASDGRIAVMTWRRRREVEWMRAPAEWLAPAGEPPPVEDEGPGPFSFGDPDAVCRTLAAAGYRDAAAVAVERNLTLGATVEDAAALLAEHGPAGHIIRAAGPGERDGAIAILRRRLGAHLGPRGVTMGAACWIYTARAPAAAARGVITAD